MISFLRNLFIEYYDVPINLISDYLSMFNLFGVIVLFPFAMIFVFIIFLMSTLIMLVDVFATILDKMFLKKRD